MDFDAIVLAADRGRNDPVAAAAGVAAKCLTPIAGSPMVVRVVRALEQSGCVHRIMLCGPVAEALQESPELHALVADGSVRWMAPQATPATSAAAALATLPDEIPVLLTTGDHALLNAEMVRHFLVAARAAGGDVAVALAPHDLVRNTYPRTRRTVLKFSDGHFCGCNLSPSHAARAADGAPGNRWKTTARSPFGSSASSAGSRWHVTRSAC